MTALSATCPPDILRNILEKLHLYPVVKSTGKNSIYNTGSFIVYYMIQMCHVMVY